MLASTLRGNVGDRAFQNLQESLLHAFAGDIAGNRRILVFASNLVDFVNLNDASLCSAYVAIGRLQQLQDDVFYVFADIAGFGQGGRVDDGKGDV